MRKYSAGSSRKFNLGRRVALPYFGGVSFCERRNKIMTELASIKNSQDRFAYVVRRGRDYPSLAPEFKTDAYRLEGCLAKVWLVCELVDGCCLYRVDSESAIVKGIAVTLCDIFSGLPPEEIAGNDPSFLKDVGIDQHLTQNRRDSLGKIWNKMRTFAELSIQPAT